MARTLGVRSPLDEGDPSLALGTSTMTLMELTAAYAGVAANAFPVRPTAFVGEEEGWFESWFDGKDSLSDSDHEAIERMLRQAINRGTGRAAMLSGPNFGKTGTTQDNRDALFVGYAGSLVVGVWVGNDDNTPLGGVSGGGLPARIWKDFMSQALGERSGPARPQPSPDPSGPVEPLDVPELEDIPLGEGANLQIREGEAVLSTDIRGVPFDFRLDENGVRIDPGARNRERDVAEEVEPAE
jgi:penicillin-binding protein 1A